MLLHIAVPFLTVDCTGAGEGPLVSDDALSSLGECSPDKGLPAAPGKGSGGDAAPGEGAAGVGKSFLGRSRIWSTCTPTRHLCSRGQQEC